MAAAAAPNGGTTPAAPAPELARPPTYIFYGSKSVKARISRDVPISEIIRQLVTSQQLQIKDPPALFALRDKDTGELVTDENVGTLLDRQAHNPTIEAAEMVEKLNSGETATLKLATFSLRTLIKERAFLDEFVNRGGLEALQHVIKHSSGNTLAYALLSMQQLMELEGRGWQGVKPDFTARIVDIIANEALINICRPATAILRRLASEDSHSDSLEQSSSGFTRVYGEIRKHNGSLRIIVDRLAAEELALVELSLSLINSLFKGAANASDTDFVEDLESLGAFQSIEKLLETQKDGELELLLEFQRILTQSLRSDLTQELEEKHFPMFDVIWNAAALEDTDENNRWRRVGFSSETPQDELASSGVLGLKALVRFVESSGDEFARTIKAQQSKEPDQRCPVSAASGTVVILLAEHWGFRQPLQLAPTKPQPLLLRFHDCHSLVLKFFARMWAEADATQNEYDHIKDVVREQVQTVFVPGKPWAEVQKEFAGMRYRAIRDRQLDELVRNDALMNKPSVKALRGRLYLESYEFVRNQRIQCLMEGAWFPVVAQSSKLLTTKRQTITKGWRFYRLSADKQYLHYCEVGERIEIRPGFDDLPEKLDLETASDIIPGPASSFANGKTNRLRRHDSVTSHNSTVKSFTNATHSSASNESLTFTILGTDGPIVELTAPSRSVYAEWIDGLSLLRTDGNICTKETADYVAALTDLGLKVRLLELVTVLKGKDLPDHVDVPPLPASRDFYYKDMR
ncbi:hypothetical protein OIV83_003593 [Microbotryomycetes sp. JL201]|nr:hypothetical protein OIV83_003593 [Microbotryomycetes sp. JL201]